MVLQSVVVNPYAGAITAELIAGIRTAMGDRECPQLDELERRVGFSGDIRGVRLTPAENAIYTTVLSFHPGVAPTSEILRALQDLGLEGKEKSMWVHKRRMVQKVQEVLRCDVRAVKGIGYRWFTEDELNTEYAEDGS